MVILVILIIKHLNIYSVFVVFYVPVIVNWLLVHRSNLMDTETSKSDTL